jgi:hypothetical protein
MSNNKQSSVEWLVQEINQIIDFIPMNKWDEIRGVVQQAKAMHKTEHFNTWWHGISENEPITFEQYYNKTFGGSND